MPESPQKPKDRSLSLVGMFAGKCRHGHHVIDVEGMHAAENKPGDDRYDDIHLRFPRCLKFSFHQGQPFPRVHSFQAEFGLRPQGDKSRDQGAWGGLLQLG